MQFTAKIDVIIPAYNSEKYLKDAVYSVLSQSLRPNKIIVINDGSTDNTERVIEELKNENSLVTSITIPHKNAATARNVGLSMSGAPLVAFIDSDDIWEQYKLEKQVEVIENSDDEIGVVYTSYCNIDEKGDILSRMSVKKPQHSGKIFKEVLHGACISGSASGVLIKKKYLDESGWFDENLVYAEDWDLWIRLAKVCNFAYSPESLVRIRVHNQSLQRKKSRKKQLMFLENKCKIVAKYRDVLLSDTLYLANLKAEIVSTVIRNFYRPIRVCATLSNLRSLGFEITSQAIILEAHKKMIRMIKRIGKRIQTKLKII